MFKIISLAFLLTFVGKLLAFFRMQQLALNYGEEYWLDAFFIVFSFTSIFDTILISGAIATTLIPVYLKEKAVSVLKADALYTNVFSVMFSVFLLLSIVLFLFSYQFSLLLVKGDNIELIESVNYLLKCFCLFPLLSLSFQLPTIYNQVNGMFQLSTLNPILLNGIQLLLIFIMVFFGIDVQRDVFIFLVAYLLTMFLCFYVQVSSNKLSMPKKIISLEFKKIKFFSLTIIPFIIFISIEEVNLLVDQYFATSLDKGSVSNLLYASRLIKIFGAIFVVSIITVFYPKVSVFMAKKKIKKARYLSCLITELLSIVTIPIVIVFLFYSENIVVLIYGQSVSSEVAEVLKFYALLIFTSSIFMIQIRLIYSIGIKKSALYFNVVIAILNYFLNAYFVDYYGLSGLAISTVIISGLQVIVFDFYLRKLNVVLFSKSIIVRLMLHVMCVIVVLLAIVEFFPFDINQYWIVSLGLLMFIYFVISISLNKKLYIRLMRL